MAMVELQSGARIEVVESTVRKTERGIEGGAKIRLPSGRKLEFRGKWDSCDKMCDMPGYGDTLLPEVDETVTISGKKVPGDEEGESYYVEEVDETIEGIAEEIAE